MRTKSNIWLFVAASLTLTACGGSNDEPDTSTNRAPLAVSDTVDTLTNQPITINVLANDSDPDEDNLTIVSISAAANGTVTIAEDGASLLYTSEDGFLGTDTFSYTISDTQLQATADVTVNVSQALTLQGRVTDAPIAHALVTITLGGATYTATADADGKYEITVRYQDSDALLTIAARGSEDNDQAFVEFFSLLPSLGSLQQAAGEDGVLDRSESSGTNVTNVSTAAYVLTVEANGGAVPSSEAELEQAETSVSGAAILQLAAVIKLIVDNPDFNLPDGITTVAEFAANTAAYNEYVEAVNTSNPDLIQDIVKDIIQDDDLVAPPAGYALAPYYLEIPTAQVGFISKGGSLLEMNSDGTGRFAASSSQTITGTNTDIKWELDGNGYYRISFDTPTVTYAVVDVGALTDNPDTIDLFVNNNYSQVPIAVQTDGLAFKPLVLGTRVDTVDYVTQTRYIPQPVTIEGETYQLPDLDRSYYVAASFHRGDRLQPIVLSKTMVTGDWALRGYIRPSANDHYRILATDQFTLNENGTLAADKSGVTGTWSISEDNTTLTMKYGDVTQNVRFLDQLDGVFGAATEISVGTDSAYTYEWAGKFDKGLVLTQTDFLTEATEYWLGGVNSWIQSHWDTVNGEPIIPSLFGWQFGLGSLAYNVVIGCAEFPAACNWGSTTNELIATEISYEMAGNKMLIDRRDLCGPGWTFDHPCRLREWVPVQQNSKGWILAIEQEYENWSDNGSEDNYSTAPNLHPRMTVIMPRTLPSVLNNSDVSAATADSEFHSSSAAANPKPTRILILPTQQVNQID